MTYTNFQQCFVMNQVINHYYIVDDPVKEMSENVMSLATQLIPSHLKMLESIVLNCQVSILHVCDIDNVSH